MVSGTASHPTCKPVLKIIFQLSPLCPPTVSAHRYGNRRVLFSTMSRVRIQQPAPATPDLVAERLQQTHLRKPQDHKIQKFLQYYSKADRNKTLSKILFRFDDDFFTVPPIEPSASPHGLGPRPRPTGLTSRHDFLSAHLEITDYIAVDCEMVGISGGGQCLARVAAVNEYGVIMYDAFVAPTRPVVDYRTRWSGISAAVLEDARRRGEIVTFLKAQFDIQGLLNGRTVVGHAISNDLKALELTQPANRTIDTQKLSLFGSSGNGLKTLIRNLYGIPIQEGKTGHDPVEDARASMLLFRTFKEEYLAKRSETGTTKDNITQMVKPIPMSLPYPLLEDPQTGSARRLEPLEIYENTVAALLSPEVQSQMYKCSLDLANENILPAHSSGNLSKKKPSKRKSPKKLN